jgi:hypothetical protein
MRRRSTVCSDSCARYTAAVVKMAFGSALFTRGLLVSFPAHASRAGHNFQESHGYPHRRLEGAGKLLSLNVLM